MKELLTKTLLSNKVEETFWVCWHAARFSAKYSQTSVVIAGAITLCRSPSWRSRVLRRPSERDVVWRKASGYQNDDASSVSELSASFASLSPKRELDDEELIALHVLGGTLSRSASGTELQLGAHSRSSSFSEGEDSETKRRRLAESNDQGEPDRDQDGDHIM
jgi:hypothetical protein